LYHSENLFASCGLVSYGVGNNSNNNNNEYENSSNIPRVQVTSRSRIFPVWDARTVPSFIIGYEMLGGSRFSIYGTFTRKVNILWNAGLVQICELYE
jgi:hypothetical protein